MKTIEEYIQNIKLLINKICNDLPNTELDNYLFPFESLETNLYILDLYHTNIYITESLIQLINNEYFYKNTKYIINNNDSRNIIFHKILGFNNNIFLLCDAIYNYLKINANYDAIKLLDNNINLIIKIFYKIIKIKNLENSIKVKNANEI